MTGVDLDLVYGWLEFHGLKHCCSFYMDHQCPGISCPFMVQTRDGFVCTATGICASSFMMFSQDPKDGSQLLPHTKNSRGDTGVAVVSDHDKNGCKMQAATRNVSKKDTDRSFFHFERVCVETVQKLLKSPARNDISKRVCSRAHDMAIKTMLAYAKGQRERGVEFSLADACLRGLYIFTAKAGKYMSSPPSDDFVNHVAKRVKDLCMHFSFDEKVKQTRPEYRTLAFLYLLKQDVYHRGAIVARREKTLLKILPDLSDLDLFGFEKKKYTEVVKLVSSAQRVQTRRPL